MTVAMAIECGWFLLSIIGTWRVLRGLQGAIVNHYEAVDIELRTELLELRRAGVVAEHHLRRAKDSLRDQENLAERMFAGPAFAMFVLLWIPTPGRRAKPARDDNEPTHDAAPARTEWPEELQNLMARSYLTFGLRMVVAAPAFTVALAIWFAIIYQRVLAEHRQRPSASEVWNAMVASLLRGDRTGRFVPG